MLNPYRGNTFFEFFVTLFRRGFLFIKGGLSLDNLATDEIQLIVLSLIAISCALVGVFLVIKKMAMLTNALSHTVLLGIVCSYLLFQGAVFGQMGLLILVIASMITALLTAFFTQFIHKVLNVQQDAAIGLVFTFLFALGIVLATLFTRNVHIGIEAVMGNADALFYSDIKQALCLFLVNLIFMLVFFRPYLFSTFDPLFSKNSGAFVSFFNALFLLQVSFTAILSFRAIGVILVLGFFVSPFLICRLGCDRIRKLLVYAPLTSFLVVVFSLALSRHLLTVYNIAFSTSALVGTCLGSLYLLAIVTKKNLITLFKKA